MAPNLTIYKKLIADFTPNTPKYVFKGIAEFAQDAPEIITGEDYESKAGCQDTAHADEVQALVQSGAFFERRYKEKVITVHSNQSGEIEDAALTRLLNVESVDEPTEIVIHVNKLEDQQRLHRSEIECIYREGRRDAAGLPAVAGG